MRPAPVYERQSSGWDEMGCGCVEEGGKAFYENEYDKGVGFVT